MNKKKTGYNKAWLSIAAMRGYVSHADRYTQAKRKKNQAMRIIYCDSGFSPKEVDYMYAEEYKTAKSKFIQTSLISFEELKRGNVETALRRVRPSDENEIGIYRGWMLKPNQYLSLIHISEPTRPY